MRKTEYTTKNSRDYLIFIKGIDQFWSYNDLYQDDKMVIKCNVEKNGKARSRDLIVETENESRNVVYVYNVSVYVTGMGLYCGQVLNIR